MNMFGKKDFRDVIKNLQIRSSRTIKVGSKSSGKSPISDMQRRDTQKSM